MLSNAITEVVTINTMSEDERETEEKRQKEMSYSEAKRDPNTIYINSHLSKQSHAEMKEMCSILNMSVKDFIASAIKEKTQRCKIHLEPVLIAKKKYEEELEKFIEEVA